MISSELSFYLCFIIFTVSPRMRRMVSLIAESSLKTFVWPVAEQQQSKKSL